jgi:hypothetical protein
MSFEADFENLTVWQDVNTTQGWFWPGFGSDHYYAFNIAPVQANDSRCHVDDFWWSSINAQPPGNLNANFIVSNGNSDPIQFQVIGIPSR